MPFKLGEDDSTAATAAKYVYTMLDGFYLFIYCAIYDMLYVFITIHIQYVNA